MIYHKEREVLSVESVRSIESTHRWSERAWWGGCKYATERIVRPNQVLVFFVDGGVQKIITETYEQAEALCVKIKDRYGLISLEEL